MAFRLLNIGISRKLELAANSLNYLGEHAVLPEGHLFRNPQCIGIGSHFKASATLIIEAHTKQGGENYTPTVVIGDYVTFGSDCRVDCCQAIRIGDWVLVGHRVLITDNERDESVPAVLSTPPANRKLRSQGGISIADSVLIEDGVRIFSGVSIGQNTIIKAGAVVRESIPANSVVAGDPARIIRQSEAIPLRE
ncbi:MAG: acyltransferase [Hymenobacter sp.]|nr:MAG: acyltransferase [Hymenobacter sp.]